MLWLRVCSGERVMIKARLVRVRIFDAIVPCVAKGQRREEENSPFGH